MIPRAQTSTCCMAPAGYSVQCDLAALATDYQQKPAAEQKTVRFRSWSNISTVYLVKNKRYTFARQHSIFATTCSADWDVDYLYEIPRIIWKQFTSMKNNSFHHRLYGIDDAAANIAYTWYLQKEKEEIKNARDFSSEVSFWGFRQRTKWFYRGNAIIARGTIFNISVPRRDRFSVLGNEEVLRHTCSSFSFFFRDDK